MSGWLIVDRWVDFRQNELKLFEYKTSKGKDGQILPVFYTKRLKGVRKTHYMDEYNM